jgi:RNA polymerase sigma-70 factor (ECF subfamily)
LFFLVKQHDLPSQPRLNPFGALRVSFSQEQTASERHGPVGDFDREYAWLQAAQQGDASAFEQLYAALEPGVERFVRRLLRDDSAWADVVQETFLSLYIHLDEVVPAEKLRPFVYRVARNASYDVMRQWGRRPGWSLDDDTHQDRLNFALHDPSDAPDEAAHWLLLMLEVREAIDRLPEAQRQVLILFCEEEMSQAEIAEVLGCSVGTVKSRLFHAKKTLRGLVHPQVLAALQPTPPPDEDVSSGASVLPTNDRGAPDLEAQPIPEGETHHD